MNRVFLLLLTIGISCNSYENECTVFTNSLKESIKDDFFKDYLIDNKLFVLTKNRKIVEEITLCGRENLNITVDSLLSGQTKYLNIEGYDQIGDVFRMQISCYNLESGPYLMMYSTSFKVLDNGDIALISESSPFIDEVQVDRD